SFANPNSFTPRNSTGFINYAFYDIYDWLKAGLRAEWFKADGTSYYTVTGGFNIKPTSWLLIRPEVRGMWAPGNQMVYTGVHNYSGQLFNQVVFGIDAILIF
ncbi:MAG TPA: outer membrane beta-barrel protein, partial [Planctomycetaceae bacterium]|nr:outer membrane beta-barrel protein [Planctomycetaceae bacterium]